MTKISEKDIERFTEGDCHILARRLHRETGWPIHSFVWDDDDTMDYHVFVVTPDGKALDVEGLHDLDGFCETWHVDSHRAFTVQQIARYWGPPEFGHYSYRRAREIAPLLIEKAKCAS